jgi:hypothetical protein
MRTKALNEICLSFNSKQFMGSLCEPLCHSKQLQLRDCPNINGHNGKDFVFIAEWVHNNNHFNNNKIVLKARTLTTFELIGNNLWQKYFQNNKRLVLKSINQIIGQRFNNSDEEPISRRKNDLIINSLFSWPFNQMDYNLMNVSSLINVWLLIQDNEFVLSQTYKTLFPNVVGSCGHFYAVQYADHVLDFSYFLPQLLPFNAKTLLERIEVGLKVIQFLIRFQSMKPKLELCDIKFEHFGFISGQLFLIDSDMIYPKKSVIDSIESLSRCEVDNDCDFIDCKGICVQKNKCIIDERDDDLMRVCRNIFFMGKLYGFLDIGLFYTERKDIQKDFDLIYDKCFNRNILSNDIKDILNILILIRNKLI